MSGLRTARLVLVLVAGALVGWGDAVAQVPQKVITTRASSAMAVRAADLDGDGDRDVISASLADDKIAWYENRVGEAGSDADGFGDQQVVARSAEFAKSVAAADLDGDGDPDLVSASSFDNTVAWYENRMGEAGADSDGFGTPQTITAQADGAQSLSVADLDGDGDEDVVVAAANADAVHWYENQIGEAGADGDGFGAARTITSNAASVYGVATGDLDGDGDADVVSASSFDDKVAWYENQIGDDGADADGFGPEQVVTTSADGAVSVVVADLDADGDLDVVSGSSYDDSVAWYENEMGESGNDADGFGAIQRITTDAPYVASVFVASLDGDGDLDVLSASRADDRIAWYENQLAEGDGFGAQRTVTSDADEAQSVFAADLDGDGTPDVLSASSNDSKIAWYANTDGALPVELVRFDGRPTDEGSIELTWTTASETQNARFDVQRASATGTAGTRSWSTVGQVDGRGTIQTATSYRYLDRDVPFSADSLAYRLRQVDVDGAAHVSSPVTIVRDAPSLSFLRVFPNPVRSRATLQFTVRRRRSVTVGVYDVLGRELRSRRLPDAEGRTEVLLRVDQLPAGMYIVKVAAGERSRVRRLTVRD